MKEAIICILYALVIASCAVLDARSQEVQYTYCKGPQGQVIIVSNATCPAGWLPSTK